MKDLLPTLRRIDEEIIGHNQNIARSRVEIARLQETRLVLAGIAESDTMEAQLAKEESQRTIAGSHGRPVLIVRKMGTDETMVEGLNKAGNKRGMNNPPKRAKGDGNGRRKHRKSDKTGGERGEFGRKVLEMLKGSEPLASADIANYLGIKADTGSRQPVYNALYLLQQQGKIVRNAERRYSLAPGGTK